MQLRTKLALLMTIVLGMSATGAAAGERAPRTAIGDNALDRSIAKTMEEAGIAGMGAAIIVNCQLV